MKLAKAKEYHELGLLKSFAAVRVDDTEAGWLLTIEGPEGRSWTMKTALGQDKVYSTLDTLSTEVQRIFGDQAKAPCWTCNV